MKIPVNPPESINLSAIISTLNPVQEEAFNQNIKPLDNKDRYLHWDKLRHLTPPENLSSKNWWYATKLGRKLTTAQIPLLSINNNKFCFCVPDTIQKSLHELDMQTAGTIKTPIQLSKQDKTTYLVRSLIEEAISSSQLEGADTTRKVAKEMIRQGRNPQNRSEQMISNNYNAMRFISEYKNEKLNVPIIFELHRILTEKTLDIPEDAGKFRDSEDQIQIIDRVQQNILFVPPPAAEISERMKAFCNFVNSEESCFIHPIIKAIIIHFMLAYIHPFVDGNGRTSRALFYWFLARKGYWLMEFISISSIIQKSRSNYERAFLYTETDENDLTYFIFNQIDVINKAVEQFHRYLNKRNQEKQKLKIFLQRGAIKIQLNPRQMTLLRHALANPRFTYKIRDYQRTHNITYQTARQDLLDMSLKRLLDQGKLGREFIFIVPDNLRQRLKINKA
ncbi:MAG: Fic family protein [Pseudomonadota bacterium]|nr:Fic family protein [Pseudomonadota bacterium]